MGAVKVLFHVELVSLCRLFQFLAFSDFLFVLGKPVMFCGVFAEAIFHIMKGSS